MRSILGLDTGQARGSLALALDGVAGEPVTLPEGGHSAGLAMAIERLLAARSIQVAALSGIAVSEGPGSFTGLRIGLAWAKGVAMGAGVPLALVPSHEAAAYAARADAPLVGTVTMAERGQVLAALWERDAASGGVRLRWGPDVVPEDALIEQLHAAAGREVPVIALTEAVEDLVMDLGGTPLAVGCLAPAIAELGDRALRAGRAADPRTAVPTYGRAPNARKPVPR